MNTSKSILQIAKDTINMESQSIANLSNLLDDNFSKSIELIYNSKGRVIITGIGIKFYIIFASG